MRALTIIPGQSRSLQLQDIDLPDCAQRHLFVRCLELGICGTDLELISGTYGWAAPDRPHLVIGHESLGEVINAPAGCDFRTGDLVVGIVRRPDPVPCPNCAAGEWDMCSNGQYLERGIKALDGYGSERFVLDPAYAVKLPSSLRSTGVLVEPTSIVAKAWEQIHRIGARTSWHPTRVLVTGAGTIGLLAALIASQEGFEVHIFDRNETGLKPDLAHQLGAVYHTGNLRHLDLRPDVVVECTGATSVILDAAAITARNAIICLAGLSSGEHRVELDMGEIGRRLVLENDLIFGSVNANRRHYEQAVRVLQSADPDWLGQLITRRVPLAHWKSAYKRLPDDIKTIVDFTLPDTPED